MPDQPRAGAYPGTARGSWRSAGDCPGAGLKPPAFRLLLIRHGATAGNLEGRYIGRTDEALLPSSRQMLEEMRESGYYPEAELVFSSPLMRCRETAAILFPGRRIRVVPGLAECDFGDFEGKNYEELNGDPDYQAFIDSGGELPFPGGESRAEVETRCLKALMEILELPEVKERAEKKPPLLAFAVHGGTIMSILHHFCGGDPFRFRLGPGEGALLESRPDGEISLNFLNK